MLTTENAKDKYLFLSDSLIETDNPPSIMDCLTREESVEVLKYGRQIQFSSGEYLFNQGDHHGGLYLIKSGIVRGFYTSPLGREITLAYWGAGHFVGAPEIFDEGQHMWSTIAVEQSITIGLRGRDLRKLVRQLPNLAMGIINGLVYKSKRYVALAQIMGTYSMEKRLALMLLTLVDIQSADSNERYGLNKNLTQEELSNLIGSTRQWVSRSIKRLEAKDIICRKNNKIEIIDLEALRRLSES
jgi:CRP-like cAMP-binding protein